MISKTAAAFFFSIVLSAGVQAAPTTMDKNTVVSPGQYLVTVMPVFNKEVGDRLQESVSRVAGLENVEAKTEDSTVRFDVKEGTPVKAEQIQKAVAAASAGSVITPPVLRNTMNSNPTL